ncbi:pro-sigmaK processing inhibitor BofA family protein [Ruminococcus flavefaciens]|uniref:pro-sigmaK processing inhibitor BofA family protein n=1 Tax=Ruminococcus flavefaciens TaxID=1265 RepID=UPI000465C69A|nr:pro-sigmaK processing inhibitor BofA family protein [Ruminococcus flavefaciens]
MDTEMLFKIFCGAIAAVMIIYYIRRQKKMLSFFIGAFTGGAALFIVNKYGPLFGTDIPLNLFNILGSLILGAPFVAFIVIMNFL